MIVHRRLRGDRGRRLLGPLLAAFALLGVALLPAATGPGAIARAEDKGIMVHLSYLPGYSNWGPTNVYGTAHLWPGEGVAQLEFHVLPPQTGGSMYASWLVNTATGESMLLGRFNTNDAGDASQDIIFSGSMPHAANAVVVTVMHPGDPRSLPGPIRTMAGMFPAQHIVPLVAHPSTPHAPPAQPRRTRPGSQPGAHTAARAGSRASWRTHTGANTHGRGTHTGAITHASVSHPRVVMLPITGGGPAARRLELRLTQHAARPARRHPTLRRCAQGHAARGHTAGGHTTAGARC